jgi:hypothetical protein
LLHILELLLADHRARTGRYSAQERAKQFADGRCVYCGGLNHRAAECMARKMAKIWKVATAEVKGVGTKEGSEKSGKD